MSVLGQTNSIAPNFTPIYFDQNLDTINNKWYPKLDSLGQFLSTNPDFELQVHAFGHPTEKDFYEVSFNRAKNIIDYLTKKFEIRTHEHILTNSDNRGVVPQKDSNYSEKHKSDNRKVEFIIEKHIFKKNLNNVDNDSLTFINPDYPPVFKDGGDLGLKKFIGENLHYPKTGECVTGKVYVLFTIDTLGNVKDIEIKRGITPSTDKEAIRVVSLMKFIRGTNYGKPIDTKMVLPISFTLE
jgi:TonB family protein